MLGKGQYALTDVFHQQSSFTTISLLQPPAAFQGFVFLIVLLQIQGEI